MRIFPAAALAVAGAAASIIVAPLAGAAPAAAANQQIKPIPQTCVTTRVSTQCRSPGNVQINDAPPFVDNFPMYGYFPWIL
ncbi:hypothetical protein A5740_03090 [Mycobacterium sp. GA-1841]|uniref:hypothetical protein n=1 Tax=Mycobacterium sp. GA-1841 TaxID=1834154 RepID=UPI00096ED3B4|nr:hypothetical protein [Mycobacterium sp. GA-1841]OMC39083.1 hypothetical protein A5740_03090 [Mycobacterium sp. GA-1841]